MSIASAKRLRHDQTKPEGILWSCLRNRQLVNLKFRRQFAIGSYVVDFVCLERRLIVEIDGGHHAEQAEEDNERTVWLENQGFQLIRFWNNEVTQNLDGVLETIANALVKDPSP